MTDCIRSLLINCSHLKELNMFKPGDEKYKNLSLLFNCLNGILITSIIIFTYFCN